MGSPTAWAANVPFAPEDRSYFAPDGYLRWSSRPGETMRTLPPEGIVIVVGLFPPTEATPGPVFPPRQLPLQLSDFEVRPSWEGQVSPDVPEYRLWASVGVATWTWRSSSGPRTLPRGCSGRPRRSSTGW
ncbi:MAG TPA: hypothetical protein VNO79_01750 [Actinomycetota bacterium]|nr:hypothetical protein [Actinomycetota bacterium]